MANASFLVTSSNELAFHAVEACVQRDPLFRRVLLVGEAGSGKTTLVQWARQKSASLGGATPRWEDPLQLPLPASYPSDLRLVATLNSAMAGATAIRAAFQERGGQVFSLAIEPELTEAVAREMIRAAGMTLEQDALSMLVDKLGNPVLVRGALQRLRAEAALAGVGRIDCLFVIRTLGDFLYPLR
jgi:chromosomal replication initiation ATPase DnaA